MKLKLLLIIALFGVGIAMVVSNVSTDQSTENEYATYLEKARVGAEKKLPYIAVNNYKSAMKIQNNDESIYLEYLEQAKLLGEDAYVAAIENYLIYFPNSAHAYDIAADYYYESERYPKVIDIALKARELGIASDKIKNYYYECGYSYDDIKGGLQEATSYVAGSALVKQNDLYGYIGSGGGYTLGPLYEKASAFVGANAAVLQDGEWVMINSEGYAVARPSRPVDEMSFLNSGLIRVYVDGKYDFMTSQMNVPEEPRFDYASNFKKDVAAVCKDGKWALLNSQNVFITDYIFEDVILDEYETCLNNGVIFVKSKGKYYMANALGEKISENAFDDAYPFVSSGYAAVCRNGEWGFADATGNIVIEPQYEDAKSFNISLGAVCKDGKWGYISTGNEMRIDYTFEDCLPFASNGVAAVKQNDTWGYIVLQLYK